MKKPKIVISLLTAIVIGIFSSCTLDSNQQSATMRVYLTDAPADFESVIVNIKEVLIHRESDADMGDSGWITLSDQPVEADLMNLTNGRFLVLGEKDLEPGYYSQMRLILADNNYLIVDGEQISLSTPSATQSGLKLLINTELQEDVVYTLLLDFDASRSVVRAGASGIFNLIPVIRTVNLAEAGALSGTIQPSGSEPWVYAVQNGDIITGTRAFSDSGDFVIIGLTEGIYDIQIVPVTDDYNEKILSGIEVTARDTTELGTILLE